MMGLDEGRGGGAGVARGEAVEDDEGEEGGEGEAGEEGSDGGAVHGVSRER